MPSVSGIVEVLAFMQKGQDHITKLLCVFPWMDLVIVLSTQQQRKAVGKCMQPAQDDYSSHGVGWLQRGPSSLEYNTVWKANKHQT